MHGSCAGTGRGYNPADKPVPVSPAAHLPAPRELLDHRLQTAGSLCCCPFHPPPREPVHICCLLLLPAFSLAPSQLQHPPPSPQSFICTLIAANFCQLISPNPARPSHSPSSSRPFLCRGWLGSSATFAPELTVSDRQERTRVPFPNKDNHNREREVPGGLPAPCPAGSSCRVGVWTGDSLGRRGMLLCVSRCQRQGRACCEKARASGSRTAMVCPGPRLSPCFWALPPTTSLSLCFSVLSVSSPG